MYENVIVNMTVNGCINWAVNKLMMKRKEYERKKKTRRTQNWVGFLHTIYCDAYLGR